MIRIAHDQELIKTISLQSPVQSDDMTAPQPVLVPLFTALANTTRASRVGCVAGEENKFSALLSSNKEDSFFAAMMIKAPNTDFQLPAFLEQFQPALEQTIFAHYNGSHSSPHLRSGREYWVIRAEQIPSKKTEQIPPAETLKNLSKIAYQHFDISPKSIEDKEMEIVDRYIVSDIKGLTTAFYDADFALTNDILNDWYGAQTKLIQTSGGAPHQHKEYEIVHFNTTTPHGIAQESGLEPDQPRILFTVSVSAAPFADCEFSTQSLKQAHEKLNPIAPDFAP